MSNQEAIKIISECKEKGFRYTLYTLDEYHEALQMGADAIQKLSYLTDRPCAACKSNEDGNGCKKWTCVFEDDGKES